MMRDVSVIIRSLNERPALERAIWSVRAQSVASEIIVVDSGSTDGALQLAQQMADRVIALAPGTFTFGGALNTGANAASGEIHVALSSHCELPRRDWLERVLTHYDIPSVAATHGCRHRPDRRPLESVFLQDADHARRHPYWGLSNHASSWRSVVWQEFRFNERLAACEDKEWALRVLGAGWEVAVDPEIDVPKPHRQRAGVRALWSRSVREGEALALVTQMNVRGLRDVVTEWWAEVPDDGRSRLRHRLNYYRATEIAGRWTGERRG